MDATITADRPIPEPTENESADQKPQAELWLAKLRSLEEECRACAVEVERTKEDHKVAKGAFDAAVARLRCAVRDATSGQKQLAFPEDSPTVDAPSGDEWRSVNLADLEITGKLAESLAEAGLTTLGAIADYTAAGNLLTDIAGVGPSKAEKIEAACADWWARHPEATRGEEADDGCEGDGDPTGEDSEGAVDS